LDPCRYGSLGFSRVILCGLWRHAIGKSPAGSGEWPLVWAADWWLAMELQRTEQKVAGDWISTSPSVMLGGALVLGVLPRSGCRGGGGSVVTP
jgi:hypothetical protein